MKKKFTIFNFLMSVMVLSSMLFQMIHSYEHVHQQITEKKCEHKYSAHQKQFTHSHSVENDCSVCHFSFTSFISNCFNTISYQKVISLQHTLSFYNSITSSFFKGSLFALRAPPSLL